MSNYPSVPNFNPGDDGGEIVRTIEGEGVHKIGGPNLLRDNVNEYDAEYPENMTDYEENG